MEPINKRFEKLENSQRISYLIGGFITNILTIEEREELDAWVVADEANMQLFEDMTDDQMVDKFLKWLATRDTEGQLINVKKRLNFRKKERVIKWWHYAAAASVIGIIGVALFLTRSSDKKVSPEVVDKTDISPGSLYAQLRLPDGQVIKLDKVSDTVIGNIHIKDGEIVYDHNGTDTLMHEITIPRKGSYQLVLPDGSKVWLNAESSIRYPGAFSSNKRMVTVSGETFFEVAKDASRPFTVSIGDVNVEALGTAFNINGFDSRITLTEGSVKVSGQNKMLVLKPGDQVETKTWVVNKVDVVPVLAWTKNQFTFKNAAIEDVMKLLERWYDARVVYEDKVSYHFNGTINRSVPVSKVLELLEETGNVHFNIEDNTIIVKR
jgi:ferric-dicitrate binding protein FerR (iron transport regulator)